MRGGDEEGETRGNLSRDEVATVRDKSEFTSSKQSRELVRYTELDDVSDHTAW